MLCQSDVSLALKLALPSDPGTPHHLRKGRKQIRKVRIVEVMQNQETASLSCFWFVVQPVLMAGNPESSCVTFQWDTCARKLQWHTHIAVDITKHHKLNPALHLKFTENSH